MNNLKIRSIIGLLFIYIAVFFELEWMWGLLFLFWVIPDLFSGVTYFIDPVERKESPVLYWLITVTWLWMSAYIIAAAFIPSLNPLPEMVKHPTEQVGVYEDQATTKLVKLDSQPVLTVLSEEDGKAAVDAEKVKVDAKTINTPAKDSLKYKLFQQSEDYHFIGISAKVNEHDKDVEKHIEELWQFFYENDISAVIPNIIDERIYMIYGPSDAEGTFEASLAYRTDSTKDPYEGLSGITIPASKFAVFEHQGKGAESFLEKTWEQIYASDLNAGKGHNLEVYTLDGYEVTKAEIRIRLQ